MTLLPSVRRQICQAAERRAAHRWTWLRPGSARAAVRSRRGPLLVLIALTGTGAAAYGATEIIRGGPDYVNQAYRAVVVRDPACGTLGVPGSLSEGSPTPALLAMLGVLRRPAVAADVFPPPVTPPAAVRRHRRRLSSPRRGPGLLRFGRGVYARYVRRARVAYGSAYYVIASAGYRFEIPPPARCDDVLRREVARLPAGARPATYTKIAATFAAERRSDQPHEALCLTAVALAGRLAGSGGGGCGMTLAQVAAGQGVVNVGSADGRTQTLSGLVPDGVAAITIRLAGAAAGGRSDPSRGRTISTRPAGNVMVVRVHGTLSGASMVWRSGGGAIIRTIALG